MMRIFTKGFFKPVVLFCALTVSGLCMTSCSYSENCRRRKENSKLL